LVPRDENTARRYTDCPRQTDPLPDAAHRPSVPVAVVHSSDFVHSLALNWGFRPAGTHCPAYDSYMRSTQVLDGVAAIGTAITTLAGLCTNTLTTRERLEALADLASLTRRLAAVENDLISGLQRQATHAELAGSLAETLSRVTLITPAEANRRVTDAEDTTTRAALDGQPLPPRFPATATALAEGKLGREHLREIHRFHDKIPHCVPADERDKAETFLAATATTLRPDELRKAADRLLTEMGKEDEYTDTDRSRRRAFTWSPPDADGMSKGTLYATPALRAQLDAAMGAWAAPGKCNPADETPCIDRDPDTATVERDTRTPAQRRHDALDAITRAMLASGQLGIHNGLPVTVIVSTTLQELETGCGKARTGGGTPLPMTDVIRMAAHAHHYLLIYDGVTEIPLWLGRTRRTASPGQRIVLHDKDRGCSFPGCTMPGYHCQVHHAVLDWINDGQTNIDDLTFACPNHHALVTNHGWTTRKNPYGHTEWQPPPGIPIPTRTNNYHHPERYLDPPRPDEPPKPEEHQEDSPP